jgi:hypothetical protein
MPSSSMPGHSTAHLKPRPIRFASASGGTNLHSSGDHLNDSFFAGKLQQTESPFGEYEVCIRFIDEGTHSGAIAISKLDGTPLGCDQTAIYSLTDQQGNIYSWRWSGKFAGIFYLGELVG